MTLPATLENAHSCPSFPSFRFCFLVVRTAKLLQHIGCRLLSYLLVSLYYTPFPTERIGLIPLWIFQMLFLTS